MSTNTQIAHYLYTIDEWNSSKHQKYLDIVFKNNDIKNIYDIGANVGGTASIFLNYESDNNKNIDNIYCFEPDNDNMIFLKDKLEKFIKNKKITCIQKGVYYGRKEAKVFGAGHISERKIHCNVGGYSIEECMKYIVEQRNINGENIYCEQIGNKIFELDTLENLCENYEKPDFIKIDVEGAEKNILLNSQLIKNAKYIIVEWNQNEDFNLFLKDNLPEFKIISNECDYLLKNITK